MGLLFGKDYRYVPMWVKEKSHNLFGAGGWSAFMAVHALILWLFVQIHKKPLRGISKGFFCNRSVQAPYLICQTYHRFWGGWYPAGVERYLGRSLHRDLSAFIRIGDVNSGEVFNLAYFVISLSFKTNTDYQKLSAPTSDITRTGPYCPILNAYSLQPNIILPDPNSTWLLFETILIV